LYFEVPISRDANTPENPPVKDELELTVGILTRVEVFTRPGQAGTLRVRVMDELTQVAPSRAPQYIAGNGEAHVWTGRYALKKRQRQLQVWAWNTSTLYAHGCHIGLTVQEPEEADPFTAVRDLIAVFKRLLGVE